MTMSLPQIGLDPVEEELVSLLDSCCDWINAGHPQPSEEEGGTRVDYDGKVTARIAGGWVRDKLLRMESHDLDVSLSVMTGLNFALLFRVFLSQRQLSPSTAASSTRSAAASAMSRITKISANPEQSKSLETATANILGLSLDFVNLRKEIYEGNSRIPIMSFGTPLEDAERRDITINSLFFNVKSREVEDWTGKGLSDMRAGLIRTPLPSLTTFLDDPLRILRCIRFASRFNYELDADIVGCLTGKDQALKLSEADGDPRLQDIALTDLPQKGRLLVRDALINKVSRERIGTEVDKMLSGPNPFLALRLLDSLDLYSIVFHMDAFQSTSPLRSASTKETLSQLNVHTASSRVLAASQILDDLSHYPTRPSQLFDQVTIPEEIRSPLENKDSKRLLHFASALLPLFDVEVEVKKGKWTWSGEKVLMTGLKLGRTNTLLPVQALIRAVKFLSEPSAIDSSRSSLLPNMPDQVEISRQSLIAMLLRDKNLHNPSIGVEWQLGLTMAFVKDVLEVTGDTKKVRQVVEAYRDFCETVQYMGIADRLDEKPLMDGNELLATLSLSPSPLLPKIQNALLIWQLARPVALSEAEIDANKREAQQWLQAKWEAGAIVRVEERGGLLGKVVGSGGRKKAHQPKGKLDEEEQPPLEKRRKSDDGR